MWTEEEIKQKMVFTHDFVFKEVMSNEDICRLFLETFLKIKVDHIEYSQKELEAKERFKDRGVRFDVYVKGSNAVFDIEMQTTNNDDLFKRARYYSGRIDANALGAGAKFREMKDSYVIFICLSDALKGGLPIYDISRKVKPITAMDNIMYDDGSHIIFVNPSYRTDWYDPYLTLRQKAFLQYLTNPKVSGFSGDVLVDSIITNVAKVQRNEALRKEFADMFDRDDDIRLEGEIRGQKKERIRNIQNMFEARVPLQFIQSGFQLSDDEVEIYVDEFAPDVDINGAPYRKGASSVSPASSVSSVAMNRMKL